MLILIFGIDCLLMSVSVIVFPILLVCSIALFGQTLFDKYEDVQNAVFGKVFGMQYMEIKGFKCQRTILMFQLESIPQIFF
jgi:hypothetical protein